jgi:hypothetical protein
MDIEVDITSACESIRRVSQPSIRAVSSLAIVLSRLSRISTIKYSKDVLDVLVASHLSAEKCANSADDECMQLTTNFCVWKFCQSNWALCSIQ